MKLRGQNQGEDFGAVLKGVSRRVVVVEPKGQDIFEQAIFLVRDTPMTKKQVLREACRIAERYQKVPQKANRRRIVVTAAFFLGLCVGTFISLTISHFV